MQSKRTDFGLSEEELRRLGRGFVDLLVHANALETGDPVLPMLTGTESQAGFREPVPRQGMDPLALFAALRNDLLPAQRRNGHPRFFGYVCASADPAAAFYDGLASCFNQNVTAWRSAPGAVQMERQVLRWLDELCGFGGTGEGLLVGGGSAANATALAVALRRAAQRAGAELADVMGRLIVYRSAEAHLSFDKALRVFGVPARNVRTVAVDAGLCLRTEDLARQMEEDRARGLIPACVCVSAGTASTGAVDPLGEAAEIAARHGAWCHVDGAYGAPAAMVEELAFLREGLARADSLSIDPHKWLFAPLDVGCLLVRDEEALRSTFGMESAYIAVTQEDPVESFAFFERGLELSRRNRALKVWAILKTRGADAIAAVIARNIELRRHLDRGVARALDLEALGSGLSIACFRWHPPGLDDEATLDALNRRILERLVASGRFFLSATTIEGRFALRVCIVNFRTREADVDLLLEEVARLGGEVA